MIEVSRLAPKELLKLHAAVAEQLRAREITRSSNNPTGDLAEYLFCKAFQWHAQITLIPTSTQPEPTELRYQIKGPPQNPSQ